MNLKETVMKLSDAYGASGNESDALKVGYEMMKKLTDDCCVKNGNVIGSFGTRSDGKNHVLIDAHIDSVGFAVTHITDDGFLKIANIGGIDRRLLAAQQVVIMGREKIKGVICSIPPHLSHGNDGKAPEMDSICIDVGMTRAEAEKVISLGDTVVFLQHSAALAGDRITGASLDDRSGCAAVLYAAELLKNEELGCSYTVMLSAQEEVGERGAKIGAFDINPDIALAVDTSFAIADGEPAVKCGKLGGGCMIGIAPVLDRELSEQLIETARKNSLPYQIEVMGEETGTNADRFSVNRCGARAATLSIPLRYMHTPAEVISLSDVENTAKLIAAYIKEVR